MFRQLLCIIAVHVEAVSTMAQVPVSGIVTDPSGAAVAGATVSLAGISAKTDDMGRFHIDPVKPGRFRIAVAAGDAFKPLRRDVTIVAGIAAPSTNTEFMARTRES